MSNKTDKILKSRVNTKIDLTGESLKSADLSGKDFSGSCFKNANLSNSNLSNAILSGCDLTGCNFKYSSLSFAVFDGALRSGLQVIKHASINIGDYHHYAFLCTGKDGNRVLINEDSVDEHEYSQSKASTGARILYQLLIHG